MSAVIAKFCDLNLSDENITLENFVLLTEGDLRELGFKMGARKLLLQWIASTGMAFC